MATQLTYMFSIWYNAQQQKEAFELPANIKAVFTQLARAFQASIRSQAFNSLFQETVIEYRAPEDATVQKYQRHREQIQAEAENASRKFREKTTQPDRFTRMIADWTIEPEVMAYTARTLWTGGWDDFVLPSRTSFSMDS